MAAIPPPTSTPAYGVPVPVPQFNVGDPCMARWTQDNKWYEAVVHKITGSRYIVKFIKYGNFDSLPVQFLQKVDEEVGERIRKYNVRIVSGEEMTVPDALLPHEDDTPQQRLQKRKAIRSLKGRIRLETAQKVRVERQDNWKKFQATSAVRPKPGFITGIRKESIFRTNEDMTGRVGIPGSVDMGHCSHSTGTGNMTAQNPKRLRLPQADPDQNGDDSDLSEQ